jgi:hypothetical protein
MAAKGKRWMAREINFGVDITAETLENYEWSSVCLSSYLLDQRSAVDQ